VPTGGKIGRGGLAAPSGITGHDRKIMEAGCGDTPRYMLGRAWKVTEKIGYIGQTEPRLAKNQEESQKSTHRIDCRANSPSRQGGRGAFRERGR
jgi:hypothetical protein